MKVDGRAPVTFKLTSAGLDFRICLDGDAGVAADVFMGYTKVKLLREVSEGVGDTLKPENAEEATRDGQSAGFDDGAVVWIKLKALKTKDLTVPGGHGIHAGSPACAVHVTLRRAKLAKMPSLMEEVPGVDPTPRPPPTSPGP